MPNWCTPKQYRQLFDAAVERGGYVCHWCRRPTRKVEPGTVTLADDHATLDHVIPRRRKGPNDPSNVVMACNRCNQDRERTSGTAGALTEAELILLLR